MQIASWIRAGAHRAQSLPQLPLRVRFVLACSALLAYALVFPLIHPHLGQPAGMLNTIPAVACGWLLGVRGALVYGLLAMPLNIALYHGAAGSGLSVLAYVVGTGACILVAAGVGWARDMHERLERHTTALRAESRRLADEIERRRQAEARLTHEVLHDPLTNLPNRRLFLDRLQHAFDWSRRHPHGLCAVLYLDLDGFKDVNDSLGHGIGDRVLVDVAGRLQTSVRAVDTVARVGGDEFAIVLDSVTGRDGVRAVVERLRANLAAAPAPGSPALPMVRASIGAVIGLARYQHVDEILRDADSAMYLAKAGGGDGFVIFSPDARAARAAAGLEAETS